MVSDGIYPLVLSSCTGLRWSSPMGRTFPDFSGSFQITPMTAHSAIVQKLWNYCNILRDDGLSYGDDPSAESILSATEGLSRQEDGG